MNICENYAALLDLYIDGELSVAEMEDVQQHLAVCPACQAYVDDAFAIRAAFPDVEDTVLPEDFSAGVMAAIANASRAARPRRSQKRSWTRIIAPLAACCAIVLFVQNTNGSKKDAPMAAGSSSSTTSTSVAYSAASASDDAMAGGMMKSEAPESMVTMDSAMMETACDQKSASSDGTAATEPAMRGGILCLSPEQAEAHLSGHDAVENEDGILCYTLSAEDYTALLNALEQTEDERNVISDTGALPADYVLVYQAD